MLLCHYAVVNIGVREVAPHIHTHIHIHTYIQKCVAPPPPHALPRDVGGAAGSDCGSCKGCWQILQGRGKTICHRKLQHRSVLSTQLSWRQAGVAQSTVLGMNINTAFHQHCMHTLAHVRALLHEHVLSTLSQGKRRTRPCHGTSCILLHPHNNNYSNLTSSCLFSRHTKPKQLGVRAFA